MLPKRAWAPEGSGATGEFMIGRTKIVAAVVVVALISGGILAMNYAQTKNSHLTGSITITDEQNRTYTFQQPLTRIVSLDPAATATFYALGAYRDLVGIDQYAMYPPNSTLPVVGDFPTMNVEQILNLTPQAVIAFSDYPQSEISQLLSANISYIYLNPSNISQIEQQDTILGKITGTSANATIINRWINASIGAAAAATSSIRGSSELSVFYYLSNYGGYWTAGNNTFINDFFRIAHLRNIANSSGYYTMPAELIANDSPQSILLDQYVPYSAVNQPPLNETPAVQNGRVYMIFNDNFFNEPDFRVVYAIQWLINTEYPGNPVVLPAFPLHLKYAPSP